MTVKEACYQNNMHVVKTHENKHVKLFTKFVYKKVSCLTFNYRLWFTVI